MKVGWKILLGLAGTVLLVVIGLGAGWLLWGRRVWASGMMGGYGTTWNTNGCGGWGMMGRGRGPGMMGNYAQDSDCPMDSDGYTAPSSGTISLKDAQAAAASYIEDWDEELEIAELMEFEENFYAIIREHDTGIGAMELLVEKTSGIVGPEMGPNMMWNTRYGMHRRGSMMGTSGAENSISEKSAIEIAQTWLDKNMPGVAAEEHADPFYGYYTIHTIKDGEIEGMLSVHGNTGQVWYHSWHGAFIQMIESEDDHD